MRSDSVRPVPSIATLELTHHSSGKAVDQGSRASPGSSVTRPTEDTTERSTLPASQAAPAGRGCPRWSTVAAASQRPAVPAGMVSRITPAGSIVRVNPPLSVSGSTTVSGSVAASQSGAWTMRIDPAFNQVSRPASASTSFHYDSGFSVINDGATIDLGPFDTSDLAGLRFYGRAVNGDMHIEVLAVVDAFPITIDSFTIPG